MVMPMEVLDTQLWLEVRLSGEMTVVDGTSARDLVPPLAAGRDVLFDYSEVTEIRAPVDSLVSIMQALGPTVHRCAVVAPRPAIFGVNRQAIQLANLDDSERVRVFKDRPSAVGWLNTKPDAA
jgi:hypothetical protein